MQATRLEAQAILDAFVKNNGYRVLVNIYCATTRSTWRTVLRRRRDKRIIRYFYHHLYGWKQAGSSVTSDGVRALQEKHGMPAERLRRRVRQEQAPRTRRDVAARRRTRG